MSSQEYILKQLTEIEKQLTLQPENAELLNDLGVGYHLLGEYKQAIQALEKAVDISPGNRSYIFNLANAYAEAEKFDSAINRYLDALEMDGGHIPSLNNLADCYDKSGMPEKAIEIFDYVTKIAPDNALSFFNYGNFLLRNNRHIEAVKCYKQAITIEPGFTDAYHNIAWILFEAKAYKEAGSYAKNGLETDPENRDLIKLFSKIRDQIR